MKKRLTFEEIFSDEAGISAAFARADRAARLEHKMLGLSMPIWRDGELVWLPPEEIEVGPELEVPVNGANGHSAS